ncbi:MAG: HAD hydrolase-like protein [Bacteroidota bacterium]|nr:HAD hydrolase-like protein [Bacteroidota bacterium]MDP3433471.1 HAD hydrolase-like protein [Bacteroidota bacterium]
MPQFTHILFDLDGTLTNPRLGIGNSLKYALRQMQIDGYSSEILERFVGPPLQDGFKNLFGLNERNTNLAVEHFRTYFGEKGLYENEPYSGITELLEELHLSGKHIYVVTSKLEKYAKMIVRHFEFDRYIDDLQGAEATGKHSGKGQLIAELMERNRILPSSSVVMIGDTHYDLIGAKENEISCIAVGYGFGTPESLSACDPDYLVESVDELVELLLG